MLGRAAALVVALTGCLESPPAAVGLDDAGIGDAGPDAAPVLPPVARELIGDLLTYDFNDLDNADILFDRSGAARHGVGSATRVMGRYKSAYFFAGNVAELARDAALGPGADGITIEAFVKLQTSNQNAAIVGDHLVGGTPLATFELHVRENTLAFLTNHQGDEIVAESTLVAFPTDTWIHVAAAWDRAEVAFFVDGERRGVSNLVADIAPVDDHRAVRLAKRSDSSLVFDGSMDELKISSYAKTPEQIVASMNFDSADLSARCGDRLLERAELCDGQAVCCTGDCEPVPSDPDCTAAGGSCRDGTCQVDAPARVDEGLVALYQFDDSTGGVIYDESGMAPSVDLTVVAATVVQERGFVHLEDDAALRSNMAEKIADGCVASNQLTIEAWVTPENGVQGGPARIATQSLNIDERNFMLGQERSRWVARVLTAGTDLNGIPMIGSALDDVQAGRLVHLVVTVANGVRRLYLDGRLRTIGFMPGDFATWVSTYPFMVGNETSGNRAWSGDIHLIAIYHRALSELEVAANFAAGPDP